jgi:hypothetical protein
MSEFSTFYEASFEMNGMLGTPLELRGWEPAVYT